jgi:hypothetical protein
MVTVMILAAIASGTVRRGSMISPALAAIAENPKKVMNASAAMVTIPIGSVLKFPVKVPTAVAGPRKANAPAMKASNTATFAPVTNSWKVPLSSVPRALSTPSRTATRTPELPCGSTRSDSGRINRKTHSSIVAR